MPRARLIKPGFFTNEELLELPYEGRLLFAGLWVLADRAGRLEDRPKRIKIELFPADNLDIDALLEQLNQRGFIHRYSVGSQLLIHVRSFAKHQSPHPKEVPSRLPACDCEAMHEGKTIGSPTAEGVSMGEQPPASNGLDSDKPRKGMGEPTASPSVAVAVAGSSVAVAETDAGFGDRYGTLTLAFGGTVTQKLADEFKQIAEDHTLSEITTAIGAARRETRGGLLYPSVIYKHLPAPVAAPESKGQNVMEIHKRNLELERIAWERKNPGIPFEVSS